MLAIRMQRAGRTRHAQFRVIVQDRRFSPKSGRVVAYVGSYDPHTKASTLDKEKIAAYLKNGAQPSDRVAKLLQKESVELPSWVTLDGEKQRAIRTPEKLRRNRPDEPEAPAEEAAETAPSEDAPAVEAETTEPAAEEATSEETPADETPAAEETPAEESAPEEAPVEEAEPAPEAKPEA